MVCVVSFAGFGALNIILLISNNAYLIYIYNFSDVPETQITLGTNLRADDIREGTDVYFDCTVDAVPPAYKVQWKRDVCYYIILIIGINIYYLELNF